MTFRDLELTAKVKSALAQAKDVSAMDIDVDVHNGIVNLKGNVSRDAHDKALQIARDVSGVTSVEDHLNITSNQ
jgi:osmotically-inducible protein OsmY